MTDFITPIVPDVSTTPPDSTIPGYVSASSDSLVSSGFLEEIQKALSGITTIPGNLVRPRWQPEPPDMPDFGVDWISIGRIRAVPDAYAAVIHHPENGGEDHLIRNWMIDVRVHCYGANAERTCTRVIDGLQVAQNRETLFKKGIAFVESTDPRTASEFVKMRYVYRKDFDLTFRVQEILIYPIRNVIQGHGTVVLP
jgi:hypothetical protein